MKVIAAVLVTSVVLVGGAWAADANTFSGPTTAQFNALKAQVATLQKANGILTLATAGVVAFDKKCLGTWKGETEYTGFNLTYSDGSTASTGTALDWTFNQDTPEGYLPLAKSDCTNLAP